MAQYTYNPSIFEVKSIDQARRIIVTEEAGLGTDERWAVETPYVADLIHETINVRSSSVLVDYGCGIGRLAKELISKFGCRIVGIDTSTAMRALAVDYVQSDRFFACSPAMLDGLVERGFLADAAFSVWVLQHCLKPAEDIDRIHNALRPGSSLFVLNCLQRAVPTKEQFWLNDGIDIRSTLSRRFCVVSEGKPSAEKVANHAVGEFWSHLRKA